MHARANYLRTYSPLLEDREITAIRKQIQTLKAEQAKLHSSWNSLRGQLLENIGG